MKGQGEAYDNRDETYQEVCDFLDSLSREDPFQLWESGRMNFWRHNVHAAKARSDSFFRDNVHLWRTEEGQLVALCISEYGRNDLFVEIHPAARELYPDILRWIDECWAATRCAVEVDLFSGDREKIRRLEGNGYSFLGHFENKRTYDLDSMTLDYTLEDKFSIRTLAQLPDVDGRVALVQNAFRDCSYSETNLRGMVESPDYIGEYDLMVVSPDALPVAYCVGWRERSRPTAGYIEPVGTHAGYRRRGFAQAVILECFARMKRNGIRTVEIACRAEPHVANFLYDSLLPTGKREVHKYRKGFDRQAPD